MTREIHVDITKGLLCFGMVLAHCIQFMSTMEFPLNVISQLTNLIAFSGFSFCFGYGCYLAYYSKEQIPWDRIGATVFKCYVAFIISGSSYRLFVTQQMDLPTLLGIVFLTDIPDYSEFLISFGLLIILGALLKRLIVNSIKRFKYVVIIIVVCLLSTYFPRITKIDCGWVGLLVGDQKNTFFPVVPYFSLFFTGCYFAYMKIKINRKLLLISFIGPIAYLLSRYFDAGFSRFPPSLAWILSSSGLVYICYSVACVLANYPTRVITRYFNYLGHNVLSYLIITNIFIFLATNTEFTSRLGRMQTLLVFVATMGFIFFVQSLSVRYDNASRTIGFDTNS